LLPSLGLPSDGNEMMGDGSMTMGLPSIFYLLNQVTTLWLHSYPNDCKKNVVHSKAIGMGDTKQVKQKTLQWLE